MEILGKSPISVPAFVLAKVAFAGCVLFFIVRIANINSMLYVSPASDILGIFLYVGGFLLLVISIAQLGESARVGIPQRDTQLTTHGTYRFSRNPVYVGAFFMCAGSCLYAIHVVNFLLFAIAVIIHLRIVMREEQFLEQRFGQEWLDYKNRVPRYIGTIKKHRT